MDPSGSDSGEVAGASGVGTTTLLVSTTECFQTGCSFEDAVLKYNGSTGAFIGTHIPTIADPWGMAYHPIRESLLIVSRADSTVREYNAQTGAFVRVLVSPGAEGLNAPQGLALTPTGRLLVASNQTTAQPTKFNGILEFDSTTGAYISVFVNGGSTLSETCSNPICLRGPNAMFYAPNNRIYVVSTINDSVQDYALDGTFLGAFLSAKLIGPGGLTMRPAGTTNAGNILVSSRYIDSSNNFDDTVVEFNGNTRLLVSTNGGVVSGSLIRPGPLTWHTDGHLLVGERAGETPPFFADRVSKKNGATGASMGFFTPVGDLNSHQITSILHLHTNYATDDTDADLDTDMMDFAAFQRCFPSSTTSTCLGPFDDNKTGTIGRWDFLAFLGNFHGPRKPCTTAGQCNDNDTCTTDQCVSGFCSNAAVANGTSCADSLFCDGPETCQGGVCRGTSPCIDVAHCNEATDVCRQCLVSSECNDNNPCTDDTCTASFTCQYTAHTRSCNDGNPCTTNDQCSAGACVGGPPPNCNDNNVCSTDSCDPQLGGCIHVDNLLPCDDGNACTLQDFCLQGTCRRGRDRECNDSNACTDDTCNAISGCVYVDNTDTCDDGDSCTVNDACDDGECVGTPMNCSDSVACTVDRCINGVCQNVPDNSRCTNGNWCDGTETCHLTQGCQAGTPPCNDNIACTTDSCNPDFQNCTFTPNHASCGNGQFCDGVEQCNPTAGCQAGTPVNCSAQNGECTNGVCNETTDACEAQPKPNNTACNDQLFCTISESCQNGVCTSGTPRDCSAQNGPCTDGVCNESTDACVAQPKPNNTACDDQQFCTVSESCQNGTCTNGSPRNCSAQNGPCTDGVCSEATDACVAQPKPNNTACDDQLFCTVSESCQNGVCTNSTPRNCSAQNGPCTDGVCNESTDQCVAQPKPNNTACDDQQFCTVSESCQNGTCTNGSQRNCDDSVSCTEDSCSEATDACVHLPVDEQCADGDFCNGDETCHITAGCQAGTAPDCDDQVGCTIDSCNETTALCEHAPDDGACDDGQFCNGVEQCDDLNGCQNGTPIDCSHLDTDCTIGVCNEGTDTCISQAVGNGSPCDDGQFCTSVDSCNNGNCVGSGDACTTPPNLLCNEGTNTCVECLSNADCNDDNGCTNDVCTSGQCFNFVHTDPCDDGLFCTINDHCLGGSCVGGGDACPSAPNNLCNEDTNQCVECIQATDCGDDGNECTDTVCNSGVCGDVNNNATCDDHLVCTVIDICSGGICGGAPRDCNDNVNCTDDSCEEPTGCIHVENDPFCDNGDFCDGNEFCDAQSGCTSPGSPCQLSEHCDEANNACVECLFDNHCDDDGLFCNGSEICDNGTCSHSGDPCTLPDVCDEDLNDCVPEGP